MPDLSPSAIQSALQAALKEGDKRRLSTLRLLSTSLKNAAVAKMGELTDDESMIVVTKEVKRRLEAAELFDKGGRADRAEEELAEAEILREFLPAQLSEEELNQMVDEAIAETGGPQASQLGPVMKTLSARIAGRADGRTVSDLVRKKLQGP